MKYTDIELINWMKTAKGKDICPFLTCEVCGSKFERTKSYLYRGNWNFLKGLQKETLCCSLRCQRTLLPNQENYKLVPCIGCGKETKKNLYSLSKFKNSFCSKSCAATHNNAHKTHGTRRSKLEVWLEEQLPTLYPDLEFHFNRKDTINSELDIYIPSLKLAFELNGIFHYEPIFGPDQLARIQNNDQRKFQACLERGIELCLINTSSQIQFNTKTGLDFLKGIQEILNQKLVGVTVFETAVSSPPD